MSVTNFNVKNWSFTTSVGGHDSLTTSVTVTDASLLPTAPFYAVWWNSTDYTTPDTDPNAEIIKCTVKTGNVLTVVRGQEGISATAKNTAAKTYTIAAMLTAGMFDVLKDLLLDDLTGARIKIGDNSYEVFADLEDGVPTVRLRAL